MLLKRYCAEDKLEFGGLDMEIRDIKDTDDLYAISHIYEASWRFAYKNIIPESYLGNIPAGYWVSFLKNPDINTLVMIENGIFIGTSSYCKSRFEEFADFGEIISIYMLPEYIGKGYGKKLLEAVVNKLVALDYHDIFLWVLEDNLRARAFYEKAGFTLNNKFLDDNIGGKELREVQYCYHR